jgi:hypothetical protein
VLQLRVDSGYSAQDQKQIHHMLGKLKVKRRGQNERKALLNLFKLDTFHFAINILLKKQFLSHLGVPSPLPSLLLPSYLVISELSSFPLYKFLTLLGLHSIYYASQTYRLT